MDGSTRKGPGRPRTRGHLGALSAKDPIEVLPPTAMNILTAARRILEQEGFGAMSLSAIAEEAGEAKASIGYHFGNKEGLIVALVDSLVHEANRGLVDETHRFPMGEQRVRALIEGEERIVEDIASYRPLLEILPHAMRDESLRARISELYAGYRETILEVLDASTGPDRAMLQPFAMLMIAMVDGLSIQNALDPEGANVRAATALWEQMIRAYLRDRGLIDIG
ncbi:MAG: TetR/AcrR family transcriptional regulator [Coriobacteriia bacterium]|nr:TetR/AcrR family transcriptional regulator [Coriobacteriia bacterium]MBN2822830.1 TetR/AcrR family transcriptional regulator [Coriobacteriia bacterium]